jgi:penicillin-binding protein 2
LKQGLGVAAATRDTDEQTQWKSFAAPGGAVLVLDAKNGSVVAMASAPDYDPSQFVNGIPTELWKQLNDPENDYPLTNRAIQGQYAPGSTFKHITAIAGLESGVVTPDFVVFDGGSIKIADREFNNAGKVAHGPVALSRAMAVSSDVYFYRIGAELWKAGNRGVGDGEAIQDVSRRLGFGAQSGIALSGEAKGRIPDPAWKKAVHKERPDAFPFEQWLPGDNVNLSIGQGDTLVTPLQLGMSYVTFLNGGALYTPRVASKVVTADGLTGREIQPQLRAQVSLPTDGRNELLEGFRNAVASGDGTAFPVFRSFRPSSYPIAGKTGTAQVTGKQDTSWFVSYAPANDPQYVIVAVLEESGFGSAVAAPVVRRVYEAINGQAAGAVSYQGGRD